jgi:raffinose/stachyose/melibiose transport system permease protein/N-acetylglucosamine transport system permease protein
MEMQQKKLSLKRMATSQRIVFIFFWLVLTVITIYNLSIPIYAFIQGLKTHTEVVLGPFKMPLEAQWHNYIDVFELLEVKNVTFLEMTWNTLWISVGTTVLDALGTFFVVYAISKYKFPGSSFITWLAVFLIILPDVSGGSGYKLMYELNLTNSPLYLISTIGTITGSYLLMKGVVDGISWTYAEAAFLDGANDFQVMFKINFPQVISPMLAIMISKFTVCWNAYEQMLLFMPEVPVIAVGIKQFHNEMIYNVRMDILYAGCFVSAIPLWLIYAFFNKTLLNVSYGGGLKG